MFTVYIYIYIIYTYTAFSKQVNQKNTSLYNYRDFSGFAKNLNTQKKFISLSRFREMSKCCV